MRIQGIWIKWAVTVLMCIGMSVSYADTYPSKPIRFLVIVAPGGSADAVARLVGEQLSVRLKQTVLVENRPGAGGNVATQAVLKAPADGSRCCSRPTTTPSIRPCLPMQAMRSMILCRLPN